MMRSTKEEMGASGTPDGEVIYTHYDGSVPKGANTVKLDINLIDRTLGKLRSKESLKIDNIKGQTKEDFDLIVTYVNVLYDTSKYHIIFDLVKKHFSDLKKITPGTIGAYLGGCIIDTSFSDTMPGCSVSCAGSLPRPGDEEGWEFCGQTVVWGLHDGKKYTFTKVHETEDPTHSILHLNCTNYNTCRGFTEEDKKALHDMGIDRVTIYGYRSNGKDHIKLTDDPVDVSDIRESGSTSSDSGSAWAILAIIAIMLVIFFVWRYVGANKHMF